MSCSSSTPCSRCPTCPDPGCCCTARTRTTTPRPAWPTCSPSRSRADWWWQTQVRPALPEARPRCTTSRALGADLAPRGIRGNSVSPGYIDTEMYRSLNTDPSSEARNSAEVVLGSLGRAEDVAAAVAFLASDDAAYITGQDLVVDGGLVGSVPAA
ncbi:SDR family oxidoreductase [Saccharopolyspora hirsuta]|uniref:SDR family oxidoreductase n=1 Tax=Saccharopolyspora hirsuta TaxID=1837 RepID=A0A5M7BJQ0_SACHI|nr:SDR family oxidoreductase [Saccharopolyspora hirsuta]